MSEENKDSKIISMEGAEAQKVRQEQGMVRRDYEGGIVVVDWKDGVLHKNGKPNTRFIQAVQHAVKGNALIEVLVPQGEFQNPGIRDKVDKLFGEETVITNFFNIDAVEFWSSKSVQFDDRGLRADGGNTLGARIQVDLNYGEDGTLEIGVLPPVIAVATDQIASLSSYIFTAVNQAMQAITGSPEKLTVAKDQMQEVPDVGNKGGE